MWKLKTYQVIAKHKNYPNDLNVVIIVKHNLQNNSYSRVILYSSDLSLTANKIKHYYKMRFKIEFVFRDSKQYFGLEDFMNVKEERVGNFIGFSLFMNNLANSHNCMQVNRALLSQFGEVKLIDFQDQATLSYEFKNAQDTNRTPISISDSICSMGGVCPIEKLAELSEKYDGYFYLDDAHGTSIYGKNGCGYALDILGEFHKRMILTPSLSKGFGTNMGAISFANKEDKDFVCKFASTYLFSNPPANSIINSSIASAKLHLSKEIYVLQKKLFDNIKIFDEFNKCDLINKDNNFPIKCIVIGDENKSINCAVYLREKGFFVTAAMYPTVPLGKSIIRIAISALHTQEEINQLCFHINKFLN